MVATSNIIALFTSALGCVLIPVVAFILVRRKSKNVAGAMIAGILSFVIFQFVLRVLILLPVVSKMDWYVNIAENQILLFALFLGVTAGLFETVGRYVTLKFFIKDKTSYYTGLSHGIGHGGIEAILFVGINAGVYAVYAIMINRGLYDQIVDASSVGAQGDMVREQMYLLKDLLVEGKAGTTLLGLLERGLAIIFHIGASLMVAEGIVKGKGILYSMFALLAHAALDTVAVILVYAEWNALAIEGIVALFAGGMLVYILTAKKRFEKLNKVYPIEQEEPMLESDY